MITAVDTRVPADRAAAEGVRAPKVGPRRRLFAKYAFAFVGLVSLMLLVNGLLNVWFSYNEAKDAAIRLQREKADAAAQHIEEFIAEIEKQIGWTTATQWASSPIDQRRFDYGRLQRQVPAITELIQLDGQGHEQLNVSRLKMDMVGSGADYSADPRFKEALAKKVWFGPVYFRKESEPYMTMAVAQSGRNAGVTAAEVNLKLIWDVITAIKIGKSGYAYVVDGDGRLIAHPDISRVLRNTDLSALPQVAAARGTADAGAEPAAIVRNLDGHRVLSASAPIPKLGWLVFVEQPISEALAPLYTTLLNTGLVLGLGLAVAMLAGLLLARRMTGPIRELDAGAARIGAGALDHRIAVHTGDELEELAERFNTMAADLQSSYADLEKKVEDRTAELTEALDQQTATAEVLGVINSSPGELTPVFDAMLERATRLCEAAFGLMSTYDGERYHTVATHGVGPELAEFMRAPPHPDPESALGRIERGEDLVLYDDIADTDVYRKGDPRRRAIVDLGGAHSYAVVALRKDRRLLGIIAAYRREVRPFSDKQVALLQNFAAQAVIAIENARLITETREALDQQTATAEVLGVINSSPGDLPPVFDAMLEKATRLCEAPFGILRTWDGERFHFGAVHGEPRFRDWVRQRHPLLQDRDGSPLGRIVAGERVVSLADALGDEGYRASSSFREMAETSGLRSAIWVALHKDDALLGSITVYRQEVRPFTDKQIALLQNFAAQAVIAMENARLITETREALDQQTATAEVLQVINGSPGDLVPVFDAILEKAHSLCGADHGNLTIFDGEQFRVVATHQMPEHFAEQLRQPFSPYPGGPQERLLAGERLIHIPDQAARESTNPVTRAAIEAGVRTLLFVALRKDDALLGYITAHRKEVRPFTDKQIALLENFAAQAVIAMENARLINETREALEQQTATAEVLQVINSSPGDLAPVFDAMLDKATRLCNAAFGILQTYDGDRFHAVALHDVPPAFAEFAREPTRPIPGGTWARLLAGEPLIHEADLADSDLYRSGASPMRCAFVDLGGARTSLRVALRTDEAFLGMFNIYRQEVRPFTDKEIALLQNFAAQAVIAMENARLITETREALEQQTATAEVLGVINSSPGDLTPVFEVILEKAHTLCGASKGSLVTVGGEHFRTVATRGLSEPYAAVLREAQHNLPGSAPDRLLKGEKLVHIPDVRDSEFAIPRAAAELEGARTIVYVPLRKDSALLGYITAYRQEVRPFSDKQIALLQNFAAQAVIAMENARLITELRQRTGDLQESLEYQTATSEVLKVISQSGADLEPVLEMLVETAARICNADKAVLQQLRDGLFRMGASFGLSQEFKDYRALNPITPGRGTPIGRMAIERRVVHVEDALNDPEFTDFESRNLGEFRTMLAVPLLREGTVIGGLFLVRSHVEPFTQKQIALVTTFADQAVIAIENARLFNELRARTAELGSSVAELKMLNEVAQAVSSTLDLRSVLSTILTSSLGMTWANAGAVFRYNRAERAFRLVEAVGWDEALTRSVRDLRLAETESAMGEAVARRMPVQLADTARRASNPLRDLTLAAGFHSALIVPLVGGERILGAIILMRQEAGEFPPETVRLMQTLASQSVLAIQNARLFREIADKSEQLALASQHKSQFLANMSHELRTPLNAILGYAELLVDGIYGVLPDRPKGVLERIQNNGKHLLALINDVLDLAKIEAGQLTLTLEDYALAEVVRSVVTATEPLATSKGLNFTTTLQDNMPMGHGDARRVSQVLLNLVGNAIKFTEAGEVEISAASANGQFVLSVRDTGPGIADADQERIFGEFQQIDNTNTRNKGGTGLGLAISKRMVEMQGGTIAVESVLGRGSTFRVILPVHVDEMMEAAE
jgi:GAF domain-containing protein